MAAPGMVANSVRIVLLAASKMAASDRVLLDRGSLDRASWMMGTVEALYARMNGGFVPGGTWRKVVCEMPVICAYDSTSSAPGWKKYFTTEMPLSDWDSVCSMSLTVVWAVRSVDRTMRLAMSRGCRPS